MTDRIQDRAGRDLEERIADVEDVVAALLDGVRLDSAVRIRYEGDPVQEMVEAFAARIQARRERLPE